LIVTGEIVTMVPLAGTTAGLALEVELPLLWPAFDTVSTTRKVEPISPATGVYVLDVAPLIAEQFAPPASHRCH
jgi:hypothetical protein